MAWIGNPPQKMKTLIGINTLSSVSQQVYANHMSFFFELGRKCGDIFQFFAPERMSIDKMRNLAAKIALEQDCDYLFFIDDDVQIPRDAYFKLKEARKDIIAGITYIRGYPFRPMIFKFDKKHEDNHYHDFADHTDLDGVVSCDAVGFSCCLISCAALRNITPPYFVTGINHTEDVYFCKKVKKELNVGAYAHTGVQTAHSLGNEFIDGSNVKFWKDYYEQFNKETDHTRGKEYVRKNNL